ncbi:MAG: porin [Methylococcaceae bacterium]
MKTFRPSVLALNLALLGLPTAQAANVEALEQRIRELESRLEKLEPKTAPTEQTNPQVNKLTQKVNILERKLEVQNEVATANSKKSPKIEASNNGFKISSPNDDFSVRLRGSVQGDARFFVDDFPHNSAGSSAATGLPDKFDLKQARVWVEGRLWKAIDYKIMPDFGSAGKVLVQDAYFDIHYLPFASINVGKQKTPLSLERLQGDADGMFIERAYPTYLASNRDVGIMLHGEFAKAGYKPEYGGAVDFKNFMSYQVGVFNGTGDNGSGDSGSFDNKEVIARVFSHPFQHSGIALLEGLGIGIAGSYEHPQERAVPNLPSAIGSNTIINNNAPALAKTNPNTAALYANGDHFRLYPQAYWYSGPFGLMGEYVWSSQHLLGKEIDATDPKKTVRSVNFKQDNSAWQIQASYVLTGEDNTFQSVKPIRAFDPLKGNWGALQIATRWSELNIDQGSLADLGGSGGKFYLLDPNKSIYHAQSWAVGVNWFLNNNVRIMADYEETDFGGGAKVADGGNRPHERVFATRFQLVF